MINELQTCVQDKNSPIVQNIIKQHLSLEVFEGLPRTKAQIKASAGGLCGEPRHDENKAKVSAVLRGLMDKLLLCEQSVSYMCTSLGSMRGFVCVYASTQWFPTEVPRHPRVSFTAPRGAAS